MNDKEIADKAGLETSAVSAAFPDKADILSALLGRVDTRMATECDGYLLQEKPRDRLFEVFMIRFDILNRHRDAWRHLFFETFKNPGLFRKALPSFHNSMDIVLGLCDLNGRNGGGALPLRTTALSLAYMNAVRVWLNDDTPDMAPTMAELDRGLNKLEQVLDNMPSIFKAFV